MTSKTEIWDKLGKTDPKHTKPFKRTGGFSGTAIKPMYTYHRLTEEFGPCGKGWGVNKPDFTIAPGSEGETIVYCTVEGWWSDDDGKNIVFGVGGDKIITKNKWGLSSDDEAFKKAFTDALTNAFKMIGAGADVHMGMYDDNKYVNSIRNEFDKKNNDNVDKTPPQQNSKPESNDKPSVEYTIKANSSDEFYDGFRFRVDEMPTAQDVNKLWATHKNALAQFEKDDAKRYEMIKTAAGNRRNMLAQKA